MDPVKILIYLFSGFMLYLTIGMAIIGKPIYALVTLAMAVISFRQAKNRSKESPGKKE